MNISRFPWVVWSVLILALVLVSCQAATETETASVNGEVITEEVIIEKEINCPIANLSNDSSMTVADPELGNTDRAFFTYFNFGCDEPYFKGNLVGLQDSYSVEGGEEFTGMYEIITDEGGAWLGGSGICKYSISDEKLIWTEASYHGEGKYEGLQLFYTQDVGSGLINIRVVKPTGVETTATPKETVVVEKGVNCPSKGLYTKPGKVVNNEPGTGTVERGLAVKMSYTCDEPYLKGYTFSIVDIIKNAEPWTVSQFTEIVTRENGVWKGMCEGEQDPKANHPNKGTCKFIGESVYKGLRMEMAWDGDQVKIKVTKPET